MALEQLSPLFLRRGRAGAGECRLGRNFLSRPRSVMVNLFASGARCTRPRKKREDGAPTLGLCRRVKGRATRHRLKGWATRPGMGLRIGTGSGSESDSDHGPDRRLIPLGDRERIGTLKQQGPSRQACAASETASYEIEDRSEEALRRGSGLARASCQIGRAPARQRWLPLQITSRTRWKIKRAPHHSDASSPESFVSYRND